MAGKMKVSRLLERLAPIAGCAVAACVAHGAIVAPTSPTTCPPLTTAPASASVPHQVLQAAHSGLTTAMSFSPDGYLVTMAKDGSVRSWDPVSRRLLRVVHDDAFRADAQLAAGDGGDVVVSGAPDIAVRIAPSGKVGRVPSCGILRYSRATGKWLSQSHETLSLVDLLSCAGGALAPLPPPAGDAPRVVVMSDDGSTLAALTGALGPSRELLVFRLATPAAPPSHVPVPAEAIALGLAPHGDVAYVAVGNHVRDARYRKPDKDDVIALVSVALAVPASPPRSFQGDVPTPGYQVRDTLAVSADGALVTVTTDEQIATFDARAGAPKWRRDVVRYAWNEPGLPEAAFSPVAPVLVVRESQAFHVLDADTGEYRGPLGFARPVVRDAVIDGDSVVALSTMSKQDSELAVWSLASGRVTRRRPLGHDGSYFGGEAYVDNTTLVTTPAHVALALTSFGLDIAPSSPASPWAYPPSCADGGGQIRVDAIFTGPGVVATTLEWPKPFITPIRRAPIEVRVVADIASVQTASTSPPPSWIERAAKRAASRARGCYEEALHAKPGLAGKMAIAFVVDPDGSVSSVADAGSTLPDPSAVACVLRAEKSGGFPAWSGPRATLTIPLDFLVEATPIEDRPWPPAAGTALSLCDDGQRVLDVRRGLAFDAPTQSTLTVATLRRAFAPSLVPAEMMPARENDTAPSWRLSPRGGWHLLNGMAVESLPGTRCRQIAATQACTPASMRSALAGPTVASSDDTRFAYAAGNAVTITSLDSGDALFAFRTDAPVTALAFGATPSDVFVALSDGRLVRYRDGVLAATGAEPGVPSRSIRVDAEQHRVLTVGVDDVLRVWDAGRLTLLASFADFSDGESIAYTPGGAYVGTTEVAARVGWVFDAPLEAFDFDQFAKQFDRPEIVRDRLAGHDVDEGRTVDRPPQVHVRAFGPASQAQVDIDVHASSTSRIDTVRLYAEGRPVGERAVCAADASVRMAVPLLAGPNRIEALAFDARGLGSNAGFIDVAGPKNARKPELWVVSVGVSKYPRLAPEWQLALATADARGVADALAAQAGNGGEYAAVHTTVLLDDDVTLPRVEAAVRSLAAMRPDDVGIVFFAGHGIALETGEMVFVTPAAELTEASVAELGIGWQKLGDALAAARGRVVVLLDACHSGGVSGNVVPNESMANSLDREGRAGAFVFAAAKARQVSYEPKGRRGLVLDPSQAPPVSPLVGGGGAHGYFTGALLASLASAATDRDGDGAVELSELVDDVVCRVSVASNGKQTPWVARREIFGDFAIARAAPRTSGENEVAACRGLANFGHVDAPP